MKDQVEKETLKQNEYKLVEHVRDGVESYIVKTFGGHARNNCERNARHTYDSLTLLTESFSDVLLSPRALALEGCSVKMEYLEDLPTAQHLGFTTLHMAKPFFRRCYQLNVDPTVLWTIEDSVVATPRTLELMRSNFPLGLGFKGDLYENLRVTGKGLILADSETASIEPLGLSELVLHIYVAAASLSRRQLRLRAPHGEAPVAFYYLNLEQRRRLMAAAMEFCRQSMRSMPAPVRLLKLRRSENMLTRHLTTDAD